METLLPRLRPPADGPIPEPAALFDAPVRRVGLEIGFGAGEHAAGLLRADQTLGLIGCEVFLNGIARFVAHLSEDGTAARARIHDEDARILLPRFGEATLDGVWLLFPDPWPKTRHANRRFLQSETLDLIAAALKDGAEFRMASDDRVMQEWMLLLAPVHPAFEWIARQPADWRERPVDEPETRYEAKARAAGRAPIWLRLRRRPRAACARDAAVSLS